MQSPYLGFAWTAIKAIFLTLGGFAGVTKILEWMFRGPKIIGEVEQKITGTENYPGGKPSATILVLQLYLVNVRVQPATVRGIIIKAKLASGEWIVGQNYAMQPGFSLPGVAVKFSEAQLYDKIGTELLEYGKGVRGWVLLKFPGVKQDDIKESELRVELMDAFGKKHTFKYKHNPAKITDHLGYYPGAGMTG
jgi:hypothetical protein